MGIHSPFFPMLRRLSLSLFLVVFCASLSPISAHAVSLTDLVRKDAKTVTRADFLSWSYTALKIAAGRSDCTLPYRRSPRGLKNTLCDAQSRGILDIFGKPSATYVLRNPITRGEALRVLTILTHFEERDDISQYKDVQTSDDTQAVMNATSLKWMVPKSSANFGIKDKLTGTEALSLLQTVTGDHTPPMTQVISVTYDRTATVDIPHADLLDAIWEVVKRDYLHSDNIDEQEVAYRALEGMLDALGDPYTTFLRPERASSLQDQFRGDFMGVGAYVDMKDGKVTIISPIPGSPAERAGLTPGDQVLKVGDKDLAGLTLEQAITFIRGPKGSTAVLTIRRQGNEMIINVVRDTVSVPEIEVQWQGDIAVIKLLQFGDTTDSKIRSIVQTIASKNPKGVVLDLRNNGGGLLSAAETVMSAFIPHGSTYAIVKSKLRERQEQTANDQILPSTVKMIVLVNEASASASEIVAGALQDLGRAKVVGTNTFGKGTVQEIVGFTDGSAAKITIAEWFTPKGRSIEQTGVKPDVLLESEDRDELLRRALDLLR